ncbi:MULTISPECIES: methyltransferase domain-containing protein [Pantoea]|jgi:SAM-dependent methyltransferase|uniref:Class I SAM-dependent methyltransferase n=1 Tax=Pantoea piersonii TaxID=2364647 RepID=A0AAJ5U8W6_9GAMM|nr:MULTISPECIES: methyltransferase domain-containing protein [Pantoea]MDU6434110.1 methyltransferase domain-containing protein [Pantoea sp.]MBZ6388688.1 class I SAM-dependent methyltransferase [Pantoea piersonii]MBZ6402460.1 class I SAM-dependent methyltransferase [Pantoea piersonii]MBZ6410402.1 class I SAM-dependent methyltransferase [Pantoea piersonii]MBZ6429303.1 class I SAM-dependent methyltransferase [Pantoea piersonii]
MKRAKTRQILTAPHSWRDMPWGDYFRDALTQQLQPYLGKLYGFHMLKIGNLSAEINTEHCAISHQVNVGSEGELLQVLAQPTQLPFESKSIDACLLAHTLAWSQDPHRVLREVDRVLIDDGWMIISGFNPFSLLGVSKVLPGIQRKAPWSGRMFSQMRLLDWLSLLNYEVVFRTRFQVVPWHRQGGKVISAHLPALGCLNIVVARKRTFPLTPTKAKKALSNAQLRPAVNATRQFRAAKDQDSTL